MGSIGDCADGAETDATRDGVDETDTWTKTKSTHNVTLR